MKMNPLSSFIKKMLYEKQKFHRVQGILPNIEEKFLIIFVLSEFEDIGDFMAY